MAESASDKATSQGLRRKRSRTLYQVTILMVAVFLLSGLATYFIYSGSRDRLLNKNREKLLQMHVDTVRGNADFAIDFLVLLGEEKLEEMDLPSLLDASRKGETTAGQQYLERMLRIMVEADFSGLQGAALVVTPSPSNSQALVVAASGSLDLPEMPAELLAGSGQGESFFWVDEAYRKNSEGRNLVVSKEVDLNGKGLAASFLAVRPMDGEIAAIDSFCDDKRSAGNVNLALLSFVGIAFMSLLAYFFMSFLVRRRITRPIEELQRAAGEVMSGDLDVQVTVGHGEEFAGLKHAFNTMVANLKAVLLLPFAGEDSRHLEDLAAKGEAGAGPGGEARGGGGKAGGRARTLFYITVFLAAAFLAYGLAGFMIFSRWQNSLVDEGTGEMIRGISEYFVNESDFIRHTLDPVITEKLVQEGMRELSLEENYALMVNKQLSDYQRFYNRFCADLVERSALGLDAVFVILSGMGIPGGSTVVVSSDESMVYEWPVPSWLGEAIDEGTPYIYFEEGIPELGLQGEHTVVIETFSYAQLAQAYVGVKSMRAEVGEIKDFYESEKGAVSARYIPTVAVSLLALVVLSLVVLGFLLRRNITRPVEELSEAAGRVMQGDLDVEIAVREGEDLAGLQRAFKEMVESLHKLISRSVEED